MAESGVGGGGVDAPTHSIIHGLGMAAGLDGISTDGAMREAIGRIMGDVADPHFQRTVEETLQEMATGAGSSTAGGSDAADPQGDGHIAASVFSALAQHSGAAGANAVSKSPPPSRPHLFAAVLTGGVAQCGLRARAHPRGRARADAAGGGARQRGLASVCGLWLHGDVLSVVGPPCG